MQIVRNDPFFDVNDNFLNKEDYARDFGQWQSLSREDVDDGDENEVKMKLDDIDAESSTDDGNVSILGVDFDCFSWRYGGRTRIIFAYFYCSVDLVFIALLTCRSLHWLSRISL